MITTIRQSGGCFFFRISKKVIFQKEGCSASECKVLPENITGHFRKEKKSFTGVSF
jgi:phosphoheptose isomerase